MASSAQVARVSGPMISIIIPAYNEQRLLGRTLTTARAAADATGQPFELTVVDDGSTDDTAKIAAEQGAQVVSVNLRHIAAARNAGAKASKGDVLVFLDADTLLPRSTLQAALAALETGAIGGGAMVRFDSPVGLISSACFVIWRVLSRLFHWAAGCFVFVRREAFDAIGGFDEEYYIGEEIHLSDALKKRGMFVILRNTVATSARKLNIYPKRELVWESLRLILAGPAAHRSREGLWMWYDGQRQERKAD